MPGMPGGELIRGMAGGLFGSGEEQVEEQRTAEVEGSDGGEPDPNAEHIADGEADSGCIVQRFILIPGETPGLHQIARATGERVGRAIDIGVTAPRAVIRHAGRHATATEASPPPESKTG